MAKSDGYDVIVGGGLCGLTAGVFLAKGGHRCLLLEKNTQVGGLAQSCVFDDIVFDLGPHVLYDQDSSRAAKFLREALGDAQIIKRAFRYGIVSEGTTYKIPMMFDPLKYPFRYKCEIISMLLKIAQSNAPNGSIRHSIESHFGRSFYEHVFAPMIWKKTGQNGGATHMEWLIRPCRDINNIKKPPPVKIGGNLLETFRNFFSLRDYYYPVNGYGEYARQLKKLYEDVGGELILNCGPVSLNIENYVLKNIIVSGKSFSIRNLIWTGSVNELNRLIGGSPFSQSYMQSCFVFLTYDGKRKGDNRLLYTYHTQNDEIFVRAYYPGNIYGEHGPEHKDGICLEINHFPGIEKMSDQEIINTCIKNVEASGAFESSALRESKIIYWKDSMPIYGIEYESVMMKLFENVKRISNVYSVGRTGGYYFCMSPAAVEQGMEVAEWILEKEVY